MKEIPGAKKPELQELPQIRDRISFLYIEHSVINRRNSAITITDMRGTVDMPAASLSVLMLGPGTKITHRAMELVGDAEMTVIWVGEHGVKYYAHGRPLTHSASLLIRQAELVTNVRSRVAVARQMYQMRFPDEDVSNYTMQQLRGREGARIRSIYRKMAKETGIEWHGREYDPDNFSEGTHVNQALSVAHSCLYGVVHSVIVALGCSPGLGFVHNGHERSFVYDIADLYKAEITIPIAFQIAKNDPADIEGQTRRAVRDELSNGKILERATKDIRWLLLGNEKDYNEIDVDVLTLWDNKIGKVRSGVSYGKDEVNESDEYIQSELVALDESENEYNNGKLIKSCEDEES